jgi:hypothetical protein
VEAARHRLLRSDLNTKRIWKKRTHIYRLAVAHHLKNIETVKLDTNSGVNHFDYLSVVASRQDRHQAVEVVCHWYTILFTTCDAKIRLVNYLADAVLRKTINDSVISFRFRITKQRT